MFKSVLKLFLRTKALVGFYGAFLLFVLFFAARQFMSDPGIDGILGACTAPLSFSIFAFVLFAFIAYEFGCFCKRYSFEECLRSTHNGYQKFIMVQGLWLLVLVFVFLLLMLIWNLLLCVRYDIWRTDYIVQMFLNVLLSFFLIPCFGALFGFTASKSVKRINAYLLLVLFTLLCSPLANRLGNIIYEFGINIYPFLNIFDLFPPALNWRPVAAFGHSVLPYRWVLTGFWALLSLGLLFWKMSEKRRRIRFSGILVSLGFGALCFSLFLQPASKLLLASDDPKASIMADWDYYMQKHKDISETAATFEIKEYDLEFTVGRELRATAVLKIDKNNLNEYPLTLYHGYRI